MILYCPIAAPGKIESEIPENFHIENLPNKMSSEIFWDDLSERNSSFENWGEYTCDCIFQWLLFMFQCNDWVVRALSGSVLFKNIHIYVFRWLMRDWKRPFRHNFPLPCPSIYNAFMDVDETCRPISSWNPHDLFAALMTSRRWNEPYSDQKVDT
jgi:hypothetical protein